MKLLGKIILLIVMVFFLLLTVKSSEASLDLGFDPTLPYIQMGSEEGLTDTLTLIKGAYTGLIYLDAQGNIHIGGN